MQMTEAEIEEFLAANMKVQVATIGPDGTPHLTTLFYVVEDGRLAFWTYGASQKVVNLRRDPRITCLVEGGEDYFELRGVSIQGTRTPDRGVRRHPRARRQGGPRMAGEWTSATSATRSSRSRPASASASWSNRRRWPAGTTRKMAGPPGSGGGSGRADNPGIDPG